ncbi:F0F1 ATP synthase subunit A [Parvularcula oceani]|uniref:F0F1 ATP synthase subunit A n=1 Tax=Parvularcula oceani TaxID=1247963 RepID=UPI0004E235F9
MEQFEIVPIVPLSFGDGLDLSFTNASLWMLISLGTALLFFTWATRRSELVPGGAQGSAEVIYEFIAKMVRDTIGEDGRRFFPYIFTLFVFVFLANLLGLLPSTPGTPAALHTFTPTSHIIVTFTLAVLSVGIVVLYGLFKHGFAFLRLFVPSGVPVWLLPLITPIEIISFLSRPVSLSVRLFANMLAGHVVIKVFAGFVAVLIVSGGVLSAISILPLIGIVGVFILEFLVAFLQAFVFAILSCIYLQDALHPAH